MALPIAPTPVLKGKDADRFEAMIEEGLKHPTGPVPTPKLDEAIKKLNMRLGAPQKCPRCGGMNPSGFHNVEDCRWCGKYAEINTAQIQDKIQSCTTQSKT